MSRAQEPHKPSFPFGNPFRMMRPKGSYMSPQLIALLNKFEEGLALRLTSLKPKNKDSICTLSWMVLAMKLLSETHDDVKSLITDLELPVCDWDDKWIDVYLGNSVKLLDVCIAFSSEISRLSQGQLLLQCLLHNLEQNKPDEESKVNSSLRSWRQHIASRNPRVENCCAIVDQLVQSLDLPKIKNSAKGKVLMRAMYGVRVQTVFVSSVFINAFMGSTEKLLDLHVEGTYLWAEAYTNLQSFVNENTRILKPGNVLIKELEAVDESSRALVSLMQEAEKKTLESDEAVKDLISGLKKRTENLSEGLDHLANAVDGFFQIVLSGRDALLCNLREYNVSESGGDRKKELMMR